MYFTMCLMCISSSVELISGMTCLSEPELALKASNTGIPNTGIPGYRRKPGRY